MSDTTTKDTATLAAEAVQNAYEVGTARPGLPDEWDDWDAAETEAVADLIREVYAPSMEALRECVAAMDAMIASLASDIESHGRTIREADLGRTAAAKARAALGG